MLVAQPARSAEIHANHQRTMPQRENACAAFALSCVLHGLGYTRWEGRDVDQDLVAYLAGTVALDDDYPPTSEPGTALQAEWGFARQCAYPLRRSLDLGLVGTSPDGLVSAVGVVTDGEYVCLPVRGRRVDGSPLPDDGFWDCLVGLFAPEAAEHQAQVLCNYQAGLLAALRGPGQGWGDFLFGEDPGRCEWDVGHVTSVAGLVAGPDGRRGVLLRDSSPVFGWQGYHVERMDDLVRALWRTDGSQGGVLIVVRASGTERTARLVAETCPGADLRLWDNGSRFASPAPLPSAGERT